MLYAQSASRHSNLIYVSTKMKQNISPFPPLLSSVTSSQKRLYYLHYLNSFQSSVCADLYIMLMRLTVQFTIANICFLLLLSLLLLLTGIFCHPSNLSLSQSSLPLSRCLSLSKISGGGFSLRPIIMSLCLFLFAFEFGSIFCPLSFVFLGLFASDEVKINLTVKYEM